MSQRLVLAFCICTLSLFGCDGESTSDSGAGVDSSTGADTGGRADSGGGRDTGSGDTGSGSDSGSGDTGSRDSGSGDTGSRDSGSGDTGSRDSGSDDSGSDAAADGGACGAIGADCTTTSFSCPVGFRCIAARPSVDGVCVPNHGMMCGIAACPTRRFPECMTPGSSSGGPCVSTDERACICMSPRGRRIFTECGPSIDL